MLKDVLEYFPEKIREQIEKVKNNVNEKDIEEIRIRIEKNIALKIATNIKVLTYIVSKEDIELLFENICEKSIYSYTKQISEGFITIKGGNRVGITGSCVIENSKIININYISSLNFRIAKEVKDSSIGILKDIIDIENNNIFNTLIVSPPGGRKNHAFKRFS